MGEYELMAKTIEAYSETIAVVYHPAVVNGKLTQVLKGVFAQETEVVFDGSTGEIYSQNSARQREANASELKEFFSAENADLIIQAQNAIKNNETKDEKISELEAKNAALTEILEAL